MRKVLLLFACTAVLVVPAASVAGGSSSKPSEKAPAHAKSDASSLASTCKSLRSGSNFAATHDGQTFTQFYGTNGGKGRGAGANAFGKCASTIAMHKAKSGGKDSAEAHGEDSANSKSEGEDSANSKSAGEDSANGNAKGTANPAVTCKAMRGSDLAQFQTAYGTQPNAFGKCVSRQANSKKG
jgi:hypothetical protein